MVNRLEDKIYTAKTHAEPIIDFEKNENLRGLEHIDVLYKAVQQKQCILLEYQSFKAREAQTITFHPYLLKEFRNRWFILGKNHKGKVTMLLALDRIRKIQHQKSTAFHPADFDIHSYFKHVVGVTVNQGDDVEKVILFIDRQDAPYVITKPIHPSQQVLETSKHGATISIDVQINFELEREILGFGPKMKVLEPYHFKRRMKSLIHESMDMYDSEITKVRLQNMQNRLNKSGYDILKSVYTTREVDRMNTSLGNISSLSTKTPEVKKPSP